MEKRRAPPVGIADVKGREIDAVPSAADIDLIPLMDSAMHEHTRNISEIAEELQTVGVAHAVALFGAVRRKHDARRCRGACVIFQPVADITGDGVELVAIAFPGKTVEELLTGLCRVRIGVASLSSSSPTHVPTMPNRITNAKPPIDKHPQPFKSFSMF